ncbi:hypothetical protein [Hydrogenovibrio marinus]|uniref:Nicotinamide riboside transporter PnuC n=1 Tax=Hydrogenovibrio marinus TaxID=28885 RepID=A0A066ZRD7_HYDMR|nr:hypothetical protein [Hydrogenovibrio marinus]KDN94824.1 hypothetical protein EI16_00475 [Hydrogenovibrio marinus]BBN59283.1 hypothetical protein HVMH_0877 [Hydrogenovibrio marinus]
MIDLLQYLGALCAIIGSIWLTHKLPGFTYGWVAFLLASVSMAIFFLYKELYPAFIMELVFVYSNLVGIKTWIFKKA